MGEGNRNYAIKVTIFVLNFIFALQTSTSGDSKSLPALSPSSRNSTTNSSATTGTDYCGSFSARLAQGDVTNFTSLKYPEGYRTFTRCSWFFSTTAGNGTSDLHLDCAVAQLSWFTYIVLVDNNSTKWFGCFYCYDSINVYRTFKSDIAEFRLYNDFLFYNKGFSCTVRCTQRVACVCGESSVKARADGVAATENEFPWVASVVPRGGTFSLCAGALVNSRFVVTAAHCTRDPTWLLDVRLGIVDTATNPPTALRQQVLEVMGHPNFRDQTQDYDISLLRIEEVIFSQNPTIRPICLPSATRNDYVGSQVVVAGWGSLCSNKTSALLKLTLPVFSNTDCDLLSPLTITDRMMCAGIIGKDSCEGDSGAPVMLSKGSYYELVGLVSFGNGDVRSPSVNTRISSVVEWIQEKIEPGRACAVP